MNKIKKLSTILIIVLASIGFTQPASAINVTQGTIPTGFFPLGTSAINGTSIFTYGERTSGDQHELIGYIVNWDGTVGTPHIFEDFTGKGLHVSSQPFIQLKNGSLALTWATTDSTTRESTISVQISRNGETWDAVQHPVAAVPGALNTCSDRCGYLDPQIAQDPKGIISLAWAKALSSYFDQPASIEITTSATGKKWSKPVTYPVIETGTYPTIGLDYLVALPQGGFTAIWSSSGSFLSDVHYGTAFISGKGKKSSPQGKFTQGPLTRSMAKLVRASATKYVRFQVTYGNNFSYTVCYQTLDTTRRIWSANITCFPKQIGVLPESTEQISTDPNGNSVFFYSSSVVDNTTQTLSPSTFYLIKIENGAVSNSVISAGNPGTSVTPISLARDFNGELLVTYLSGTTIKQGSIVEDQLMSSSDLYSTTLDNDVFYSTMTGFNVPAIVDYNFATGTSIHFLMADSAPILNKASVISGKAKVGSILKASNAQFNSPNGYGPNPGKWYRCDINLGWFSYNFVPPVCSAISGAVGEKYKLQKADKGKYIAYQMRNHNLYAATQVLGKTTAKVN